MYMGSGTEDMSKFKFELEVAAVRKQTGRGSRRHRNAGFVQGLQAAVSTY